MGILGRVKQVVTERPYGLNDVKYGVEHPRVILSEINQLYNHYRAGQRYNTDGIDVFEEDWDTLIILDACRYDEFVRHSSLPGETESRISRGSTSPEFIRGNFTGKTLHDVVYVTANDWYARLAEDIGAEVHALKSVDGDVVEGSRSSHPATVSAAAREAAESYPDKRLIVHYMQPHHPYIGPSRERFAEADVHFKHGRFVYTIRNTDITHEDIMLGYRENLELVLDEVESLFYDLSGRTVVTADHGELLGDRERPIPVKTYRHPEGVYVDALVKVPWHVYEDGERKTVVAEEPEREADIDVAAAEQHLRDLGYRV